MKRARVDSHRWLAAHYEPLWWVSGMTLLIGAALTLWGFGKPLDVSALEPVVYRFRGTFEYFAEGPTHLFPQGRATTGAPLHLAYTPEVTLTFQTVFEAPQPYWVMGEGELWVEIRDVYGWKRRLATYKRDLFGEVWALQVLLPLGRVEQAIQHKERFLPPSQTYEVVVGASILARGTVHEQSWEQPLEARWVFRRVRPGFYVFDLERQREALTPVWEETLTVPVLEPNRVAFGPWFFAVRSLRRAGLALLMAGAFAFAGLQGWLAWARSHRPECYYRAYLGKGGLRVRFGPWLWSHKTYIVLDTLEDLEALAQHHQEPVLYASQDGRHCFFLWLPDAVYYVCLSEEPSEIPSTDEASGVEASETSGLDHEGLSDFGDEDDETPDSDGAA